MWRRRPRPRLSIKNTAEFFAVLVSGYASASDHFNPRPFYLPWSQTAQLDGI